MSTELYTSEVTRIGPEAQDMFEAGVYILFAEPVPPALADMSVVHTGVQDSHPDVAAGDVVHLGGVELVVDEVGDLANQNLAELGHTVLYVNSPGQNLLPGAIKAHGDQVPDPQPGQRVAFVRGS
ncbi:MAG: PTS glucitol/sorbitol transporter subunit IIA [Actinomycetales bacterium]